MSTANRKQRASREVEPQTNLLTNQSPSTNEAAPGKSDPASWKAKSPGRMMLLLWGLPLAVFITIVMLKECL